MIHFECDYTEGAHPAIIQRLCETNMEQTAGYGNDPYCEHAAELIRKLCNAPAAGVHFFVGGTQANKTVIAATLRPSQGVIAADSGHIAVHETGAIESTGHKVLTLPGTDGKITAEQVRDLCRAHATDPDQEHCVQPGMVYISFPTEVGTLYTKDELEELSEACREYDLPLFVDGARMGYGLTADGNDVTLPDIARLSDVFYIGGTKVGALFGEAIVITDSDIDNCFRYMIKQTSGLLAKGRLLGVQFTMLLENGLYTEIARHANEQAMRIRKALEAKGVKMLNASTTNQQFALMPDEMLRRLSDNFIFSISNAEVGKGLTLIRICTSWATTDEAVEQLITEVQNC